MNVRIQSDPQITTLFRFICVPIIMLLALSACAEARQPGQGDASQEDVQSTSAPTPPADSVAKGSALPSSLVYYVHAQNYLQPDWRQDDIASPLLALARTDGLSDHERFFLAQLNFMAFEGDKAYELFAEFTDRDDWYGWMARMRHAIIDARFYGNFERLERGVEYERENFPFKPEFSDITGFGERSLCAHWAEEDEHDRAVELALGALAQTPRDAPYGTFRVVGACFPSFQETGREDELFDLAQGVVDDLSAALEPRKAVEDQYPAYDAALFENTIDDLWYHRSALAPDNYLTHTYEQMIASIEKFLACQRDKVSDSCSSQ